MTKTWGLRAWSLQILWKQQRVLFFFEYPLCAWTPCSRRRLRMGDSEG